MTKRVRDRAVSAAIEILAREPGPISGSRFMRLLRERLPDDNPSTLTDIALHLPAFTPLVRRPGNRMYEYCPGAGPPSCRNPEAATGEGLFYASLAAFLREAEDLSECLPLGGKSLGDLSGTPDAIGLGRRCPGRIPRVVSAELKSDAAMAARGFGQACIYKLFSHVSYLAMPRKASYGELARMETLCRMYNIGLIVFDAHNPSAPNWEVRHKPADSQPDVRQLGEKLLVLQEMMPDRQAA